MFWRKKKKNHRKQYIIAGVVSLCLFTVSAVAAFSWDDNLFNPRSLDEVIKLLFNFENKTPPAPIIESEKIKFSFPESVTFEYNGEEVTYGTIPYAGLVWMDRNLGAERVAEHEEDELAYGDYFQWGRERDGHQRKDGEVTDVNDLAKARKQPSHDKFIIARGDPWDWNEDNLWAQRWKNQVVDVETNVCPDGWHVPTNGEWIEVLKEIPSNKSETLYEVLKLPMAGYRRDYDGKTQYTDTYGHYWSSTFKNKLHSRGLMFNKVTAYISSQKRAMGIPVRCVMDPVSEE